MDNFDALLAELAPLAKAMAPADGDDKIAAAADEAGVAMPTDEGKGDGTDEDETDDVLGKSFAVTLPDGTVQDAFDATDLIKSLGARLEVAEAATVQHGTTIQATEANLAKALTAASMLAGMVKSQDARARAQDDLIKSLQADVARIGNQPVGRKAVVAMAEKTVAGRAAVSGTDPNEIMAKAMTANAAGQLMASDVARLEASFNAGLAAPADILARLPA